MGGYLSVKTEQDRKTDYSTIHPSDTDLTPEPAKIRCERQLPREDARPVSYI
jgi:hypothetical protein